jgi:phosphoribosylformylglycinamidine cyclo-ligase
MPGVYQAGELDLAGTIVGVVDRAALIDGAHIQPGDALLALPAAGLHTNGYSLARRALDGLDWQAARADLGGRSIGDALLDVHRCYLREIDALRAGGIDVRGLAHITGGGVIDNLPRILPGGGGARLVRGTWHEPPIFALIQRTAAVSDREMFHVFNMGIGMLVVVPADQRDAARALLPELHAVGEIIPGDGSVILEGVHG